MFIKNKYIIIKVILLLVLLIFSFTSLYSQCNEKLVINCIVCNGNNATYLKDFRVRLNEGTEKPAQYAIVLNKGVRYRFSVCNAKDFEGKAILKLSDGDLLLVSSYNYSAKKHYNSFEFLCQKSAVYTISVSFLDNEEGCAVGILSLVRK